MNGVKTRFSGIGATLTVVALAMLVFVGAAEAQTPAEDQYGSPTGPPVTGEAQGGTGSDGTGSGSVASGGTGSDSAASGDTAGASAEQAGGIAGGVLPSTGGAPLYLILSGTILLGTGATLWLRHRTGS